MLGFGIQSCIGIGAIVNTTAISMAAVLHLTRVLDGLIGT
jgi:hypothetical protein